MPIVALPDGRRVQFPAGMGVGEMQAEIEKAFPEFRAAPRGNLADFASAPNAEATETTPTTGQVTAPAAGVRGDAIIALPKTEAALMEAQTAPGQPTLEIGGQEARVPQFGEPGTMTRGVSQTVSGLAEWALNRPEEALATLTPLAPAIALRYGPPMAKQFAVDVMEGLKGDREALGRALTLTALVGVPAAAGKALKAAEAKALVEGEPARALPSADAEARGALEPSRAQVEVSAAPLAEQALSSAKESLTREPAGETRAVFASEKGAERAGEISETTAVHGDVRALAEAGERQMPAEEGGARVLAETEGRTASEAAREEAVTLAPVEAPPVVEPVAPPEPPPVEPRGPSEARPTEPVPQLVGISNARVDAQRADRGLEPFMAAERKSDPALWDEAMAAIEKEPGMADRVTRELLEAPRPISDVESVVLTRRLVELTNARDVAELRGIEARDLEQALEERLRTARLTPEEQQNVRVQLGEARAKIADAEAQAVGWSDALSAVEQASGRDYGGTATGRALRARQLLLREDFSLVGLERKKRAAKGFERLTTDEVAELRETARVFKETNAALEKRVATLTEETARADAARALAQLKAQETKAQAAMGSRVKAIVSKVGATLDRRADAARERMRGKLFTLSPEVLADLAEIGASNLYHIGVDLARWSAKMVEELGERVKPHLETLWEESQKRLEAQLSGVAGEGRAKGGAKAAANDVEAAREALKGRLRKRIADYEEKIATGSYERPKRGALPSDKEVQRLEYELDQVKKRFHEGLVEAKMKRRTSVQRVFGATAESMNAMRALLTSADLSAVLRQGKFIMVAHPVRGAKAIPAMLRALASEKAAFAVEREIALRDNYPLYRASGLYLAEHGALLSKMEEAYMSRWATQLPGVGRVVKASERAYTTFLNKLRADSFDAMKATLGRSGELTMPEARVLSNFINVATGRGGPILQERAAVNLSTWFFAPRFVASRFQMVIGQPLLFGIRSEKVGFVAGMRARKLVAREYGRIVAGMSVYYGLGLLAGAEVETDTRSTDFGKIKWGNTRLDPTAGLAQITVLLTRVVGGETKTAKGDVKPIRGDKVPFGGATTQDVLTRFARFKLAPAPGRVIDLVTQTDALGRPLTASGFAQSLVVPISMGDILDTMKEQGVVGGLPLSVLSVFGENVMTYDVSEARPGKERFP